MWASREGAAARASSATGMDTNRFEGSRASVGQHQMAEASEMTSQLPYGSQRHELWTDVGDVDDEISDGSEFDDQQFYPDDMRGGSGASGQPPRNDRMPFPPSGHHGPQARVGAYSDKAQGSLEVAACLPALASFFKFSFFNKMQAQCWRDLYHGLNNVVVSAPTGAGKTVIFELAILGMLSRCQAEGKSNAKALYLAPLRALCSEKMQEWTERFGAVGVHVTELTGDGKDESQEQGARQKFTGEIATRLQAARIIIATPEMWDTFVRKARNPRVVGEVELVCIDEVHMLNMPKRGAVLESVVARFRTLRQRERQHGSQLQVPLRFVAVSATVPNVSDVGEWLGAPPACVHVFGPEYRPVPLRVVVRPCRSRNNEFVFQESLNPQLPNVIREFSSGRATLVFCATKRSCETAAKSLLRDQGPACESKREVLQQRAQYATDAGLKQLIVGGIAVHHAGLSSADRHLVGELFLQEMVMVVFCTQTLALGVNLPARLVIVKGTVQYKETGWKEYDALDMLQIIGRAGRPQFDTEGVAVILADQQLADKWKHRVFGDHPIESNLADGLTEALLAEVVASTVKNAADAAAWIHGTFLAIRAGKYPQHYAPLLKNCENENPLMKEGGPDLGLFLQCLCKQELAELQETGLLKAAPNESFTATPLGAAVVRLSAQVASVKALLQAERPQCLQHVFELLASLPDFEDVRPKQGERAQLRQLAKTSIRWTFKSPVDTYAKKVNVLLQLALADPPRTKLSWDLSSTQRRILPKSVALMRLVMEYFKGRGQGDVTCDAITLEKCLRVQLWYDTRMQVRQLPNIGDTGTEKLLKAGMGSLEALACSDPRYIELAVGRKPPFGNQLQEHVRGMPRIAMHMTCDGAQAVVNLSSSSVSNSAPGADVQGRVKTSFCDVVLFGAPSNDLIAHRRVSVHNPPPQISVNVNNSLQGLTARVIYEDIVGLDLTATLGNVQQATPQVPPKKRRGANTNSNKDTASATPVAHKTHSAGQVSAQPPSVCAGQVSVQPPSVPRMSAQQLAMANDERKAPSSSARTTKASSAHRNDESGVASNPAGSGRKRTSPDSNVEANDHHRAILAMVKTKQGMNASQIQTLRNAKPIGNCVADQGPQIGADFSDCKDQNIRMRNLVQTFPDQPGFAFASQMPLNGAGDASASMGVGCAQTAGMGGTPSPSASFLPAFEHSVSAPLSSHARHPVAEAQHGPHLFMSTPIPAQTTPLAQPCTKPFVPQVTTADPGYPGIFQDRAENKDAFRPMSLQPAQFGQPVGTPVLSPVPLASMLPTTAVPSQMGMFDGIFDALGFSLSGA